MMTKTLSALLAVAIATGAATSARADALSQLAASAGLSRAEAAGLSLQEIAVRKFNLDVSAGDRRSTGVVRSSRGGFPPQLAAAAGLSAAEAAAMSTTEIAERFFQENASGGDRRADVRFHPSTGRGSYPQLAAEAGLSEEEAVGKSLNEIARLVFKRSMSDDGERN